MSHQSVITYVLRKQRPMSTDEIAAECELKLSAARACVRHLHSKGQIHIQSWFKSDKGQFAAIWAAGPGEDAERPKEPAKPVLSPIRKRHPMVAQIAALSDDFRNPFATAMWNVTQGDRP